MHCGSTALGHLTGSLGPDEAAGIVTVHQPTHRLLVDGFDRRQWRDERNLAAAPGTLISIGLTMIRKLASLLDTRLSETLCNDLVIFLIILPLVGLILAFLAQGAGLTDASETQFGPVGRTSLVMPPR
ncbi:hypothetical protein MPLDJ20_130056 [Mesorhizobium plurifarium]|uniref:Uncharacterized protein n=1 Tax=Mesorhizobium plurifarium TaxID=69974 RepID=A0A090EIW7_MESPL|nr:hypothetical protein MPLDJ20_130056 [Mesorhizobium plurifarium]